MWSRTNWEALLVDENVPGIDSNDTKEFWAFKKRELCKFREREKKVNHYRCNWDLLSEETLGAAQQKIPGLKEIVDKETELYDVAPKDTEVFPLIFKGHKNIYRMAEMLFYAGGDLVNIADNEVHIQIDAMRRRLCGYRPGEPDKIRQEYDSVMHAFFNRLQSTIDTLHEAISIEYDIPWRWSEGKRDLISRLHDYNPDLLNHLMTTFLLSSKIKDMNYLRNGMQHHVPEIDIALDEGGAILTYTEKGGSVKEDDLFNLLFRFYKHVADMSYGAVDLVLEKKFCQ